MTIPQRLFAASREHTTSAPTQQPFRLVAPILAAALLLGASAGFVLAAVLTTARALHAVTGIWWAATVQAHGHVQLFGWAGLFVAGVALHFLPRLRGAPLASPGAIPWLVGAQVTALVLRVVAQPLASLGTAGVWSVLLILSGFLECGALVGIVVLLGMTAMGGPALRERKAMWGVLPLVASAFVSLAVAGIINLVNVLQMVSLGYGLVPATGDSVDVALGIFGYLVPIALAMSAQSLPMYAGLEVFPRALLWPLAAVYDIGLVALCAGTLSGGAQSSAGPRAAGVGLLLIGGALLVFIAVFMRMMRARGKLPQRVAALAPAPDEARSRYTAHVAAQRQNYGPFVALVATAYLWAMVGGVLLVIDGIARALALPLAVTLDAARHSLAVGFIALLISGVAPRMLPAFSGGHIRSPRWVWAALWLGNAAALFRVGSLIAGPALAALGPTGVALDNAMFGISGPLGLGLAVVLAINLWPAIVVRPAQPNSRALRPAPAPAHSA